MLSEEFSGTARIFGQCEKQVLGAHALVMETFGLAQRALDDLLKLDGQARVSHPSLEPRQILQ
jgi:hypothetical protein